MTLEIQREVYTEERVEARVAPNWRPFFAVAGFVLLALVASSTPTPLYSIYAAQWGFSALSVTEVYAVYAIGVLVALLLTGGLSDLIGRRPVIVTALLGLVGAEVVFMFAGGLEWLYLARSIQGLATGLLLGATGAAMVDLHPRRDGSQAGLVNGIASAAGIGLGALLSGVLVEYARYPEVTPFVVIALLALLAAWVAWRLPETVQRGGRNLTLTPRMPVVPRRCGGSSRSPAPGFSPRGRSAVCTSRSARVVSELSAPPRTTRSAASSCSGSARSRPWRAVAASRNVSNRTTLVTGASLLAVGSLVTAATISAGSLTGSAARQRAGRLRLRRGLHGRPAVARLGASRRPTAPG